MTADQDDKRHSPEEEAHLNLVRTAAALEAAFGQLFRSHALRASSYNVLRILRAARTPITCGEVQERLLVRSPDVTRLVDRLITDGLVERDRDAADRRVVRVRLTPKGEQLVDSLDEPVAALHKSQLGHMTVQDLEALSRLLEQARASIERRST